MNIIVNIHTLYWTIVITKLNFVCLTKETIGPLLPTSEHKKHASTWDFMSEFLWEEPPPTEKIWRQQGRQKSIGTGLSLLFYFFFIVVMLIFYSVFKKEKTHEVLPYTWGPWRNQTQGIHWENDPPDYHLGWQSNGELHWTKLNHSQLLSDLENTDPTGFFTPYPQIHR